MGRPTLNPSHANCSACGEFKLMASSRRSKSGRKYYRKRCVQCWTILRADYSKEWSVKNAVYLKEYHARKYEKNRVSLNENARRYYRKLQKIVFDHYGNECACCGENETIFLSIDHVNNDGAKHRKKIGVGHILFRWIIDNKFPKALQLLCCNCNLGKHRNGGVCPHEAKRLNYTKSSERRVQPLDQ